MSYGRAANTIYYVFQWYTKLFLSYVPTIKPICIIILLLRKIIIIVII